MKKQREIDERKYKKYEKEIEELKSAMRKKEDADFKKNAGER